MDISKVSDWVYPRRCPLCQSIVSPRGDLACSTCEKRLRIIKEPRCKKCSKPIASWETEYCYDCQRKTFSFEQGMALCEYDKRMQQSIVQFKYFGQRDFSNFYVKQMVLHLGKFLDSLDIQGLVPVPIHYTKLLKRGYNQAQVLAQGIGLAMGIPVFDDFLIRSKKTIPQKGLNEKERLHNLVRAITVNRSRLDGGSFTSLCIVDDIYTTGSTMEACAHALKKAGVESIYFVVLCIGKGY